MNQEKIGKFISTLRKEKNLTQENFADRLGVSSKSISRWETGKCMPDLSLLIPISKELNVSLNELLNGEKNNQKNSNENIEETTIEIIKTFKKNLIKKFIKTIIIIILTIISSITLYILSYTLITTYNEWPIYLKQDEVIIKVCTHNDKIYIDIDAKDGYGAFTNIKYNNEKANLWIYRSRKTYKQPELQDTFPGILVKKNEIKELYYDSKLIWNENMEIKECDS